MSNHVYGGFWRRLYAFSLDGVFIMLLTLVIFGCGMILLPGMETQSYTAIRGNGYIFSLLWLYMTVAYFIYFHGVCGKTPGKMIFGMRVIRTNGEPLSSGTALLRLFGYANSFFFFNLGFLWIAFDRKKQGFHDKIAETMVVMDGGQPLADE